MKFAAGLTVSGIIGFIILEALKLVMPAITVWVLGILAIALKILLVGIGLVLAAGAIGLAFFLYKRSQRSRAEA
jgi:hypothetical protein